jgi:hypothetical protein
MSSSRVRICACTEDVERRHRLVGDEQLGLHHQGAGDREALPLPARELVRIAVDGACVEAHQIEHLAHALLDHARGLAEVRRPLRERAPHREARVEGAERVLEDHLDLLAVPAPLARRHPREVLAAEQDAARGRRGEAREAAAERGLARARFADDAERLAARELERDAGDRLDDAAARLQDRRRLEAHLKILDDEQRLRRDLGRVGAERAVRHRGEQHLRVRMLRMAEHLLGAAALDDAARLHHDHAVGDLGDDVEVVGDEEHAR